MWVFLCSVLGNLTRDPCIHVSFTSNSAWRRMVTAGNRATESPKPQGTPGQFSVGCTSGSSTWTQELPAWVQTLTLHCVPHNACVQVLTPGAQMGPCLKTGALEL